jgi:hypothetical protein
MTTCQQCVGLHKQESVHLQLLLFLCVDLEGICIPSGRQPREAGWGCGPRGRGCFLMCTLPSLPDPVRSQQLGGLCILSGHVRCEVVEVVEVGLLGCNAVWACRQTQTFRKNVLSDFSVHPNFESLSPC